MDNGEVIPGLDEEWTLGGAKLMEWIAGFCALIMSSELIFGAAKAKAMPLLLLIWIGTTFGLAGLRRQFPDEERGIRNKAMTALGMAPPKLPRPAALQPIWSASPVRRMNQKWTVVQLGLDEALALSRPIEEEEYVPTQGRGVRS